MTKNLTQRNFLIAAVLVFVFILSIQPPFDLDLGWHLRYGQYFFETGHVLKDNILSFVWPDYKWVQASWGYDLIAYQLFNHFSFFGLSLFAGIVTLLTFFILIHPLKRFPISSLIILSTVFLTQTNQMYIAGLRSQTLSTFLFATTFVISSSFLIDPAKRKYTYFLPVLFWIWANLHGGFSLGLIVISILWFSFGILKLIPKKSFWLFGAILFFSYLTPLINPWGLRIYEETFKHSSNTNLALIKEWMPFTKWQLEAMVTALIIAMVVGLGIMRQRKKDLPFLLSILPVIYLAFGALRFITILGIMLTFYSSQILASYQIKSIKKWVVAAIFAGLFVLDLLFFQKFSQLPTPAVLNYTWSDYCQSVLNCSEEITALMVKDPPKGNGFHPYGYGGYLSFRVPQVKTFVDGRMAAWEEGGQTPPILEVAANGSKDSPILFRKLDGKYHFSWVIIETGTPIDKYLDQLVKTNLWEKQFKDNLYSYYVKK